MLFFDVGAESEDYAKKYLSPGRLDSIRDCIQSAFQTYHNDYVGLSSCHSARTKACIINDIIVDNVKKTFQADADIRFLYKKQSFRISIDNGAVNIRFKKMDKKLRVHSIPTQQALEFNCQGILFEPSVNINAGYVPNGLDIRIVVACPKNGATNHWKWEIAQKSQPVKTKPIVLPIPGINVTRRNVKPRRELLNDEETKKQ